MWLHTQLCKKVTRVDVVNCSNSRHGHLQLQLLGLILQLQLLVTPCMYKLQKCINLYSKKCTNLYTISHDHHNHLVRLNHPIHHYYSVHHSHPIHLNHPIHFEDSNVSGIQICTPFVTVYKLVQPLIFENLLWCHWIIVKIWHSVLNFCDFNDFFQHPKIIIGWSI